jgi:hypothetical protein
MSQKTGGYATSTWPKSDRRRNARHVDIHCVRPVPASHQKMSVEDVSHRQQHKPRMIGLPCLPIIQTLIPSKGNPLSLTRIHSYLQIG